MAGDGNVTVYEDGSCQVSANCGCVKEPGNKAVAAEVKRLFGSVYGVDCSIRVVPRDPPRNPYLQPILWRLAVAEDLLEHAPMGTYDWRVPGKVKKDKSLWGPWLSGFWDAEGHVRHDEDRGSRYTTVSSVNVEGLKEAGVLLRNLGIGHSWHSSPPRQEGHLPENRLIVCHRLDLEAFAEKVGFRHPEKKRGLEEALSTYKRAPMLRRGVAADLLPRILSMRANGKSFSDVAVELDLESEGIPKGIVKRAARSARGKCLACGKRKAVFSVPRVCRGRAAKYVCGPCLETLGG